MSVELVDIVRRWSMGCGHAPTLRVRCTLCRRVYMVRSWPSDLKNRGGCSRCTGRGRWTSIKGVAGMRCDGE